jgi:hypothetical protein
MATYAIGANAAGMAEPWNADPLTHFQSLHASPDRVNPADDLVARDDWHHWVWQLAIHDVQVRAADPASGHLHSNLARSGLPFGQFCPFKSSSNFL